MKSFDGEKVPGTAALQLSDQADEVSVQDGHMASEELLKTQRGILPKLLYWEAVLDRKMGVEPHGPKRITPNKKNPPNQWVMFFMWGSTGCYTLGSISTGFLGWEFGLSLGQFLPIMLLGTLIGSACAGWCASLGPGTGLRQVAISRYSFGWWPSKIIALLNIIEQLGWSAIGCITGGQALSAVSGYSLSIIVGIVIISVISILFSFGGYTAILKIERYFWILFFVLFLVIYGETGGSATLKAPATVSGSTLAGSCLSLIAIMYGDGSSWCSIISDYYVHYPVKTPRIKIFLITTFGLWIPMNFGMIIGALIASQMAVNDAWATAYTNDGIGGLILLIMYPLPFAKFMLVLLSLGGIGLNTMAIYSAALSIQQFAKPLQAVPRFVWSFVTFAGIFALSVGGRGHILDFLSNFLSLLGYYNTAFIAILAIEHYYFRKNSFENYDLEGWNTPSRLPVGFAGLTAFLCGWAGAILGMVETFYVGVIAKKIGADGGDIGNELALVFTVLAFFPLRHLELKYMGR